MDEAYRVPCRCWTIPVKNLHVESICNLNNSGNGMVSTVFDLNISHQAQATFKKNIFYSEAREYQKPLKNMIKVCPKPMQWASIYKNLIAYAKLNKCTPSHPPNPLILAGWNYSNDIDKQNRWSKTIEWAKNNNCHEIVCSISEDDYYYVDEMTRGEVMPLGGSMKSTWSFKPKNRPSSKDLEQYISILLRNWSEIVGNDIARYTKPLEFTGKKARRLLVLADVDHSPPWGGWNVLAKNEEQRRRFTIFRADINKAISPHKVDHVDFKTDNFLTSNTSPMNK